MIERHISEDGKIHASPIELYDEDGHELTVTVASVRNAGGHPLAGAQPGSLMPAAEALAMFHVATDAPNGTSIVARITATVPLDYEDDRLCVAGGFVSAPQHQL